MIRSLGADYFNPDEAARRLRSAEAALSVTDANSLAWNLGRRYLERALHERLDFAFETTLGGQTITDLLARALQTDFEVRMWYVGLESVELHVERVRARVSRGGHDISAERIRQRFDSSRLNLIRLIPGLTELRLYDNSRPGDPQRGKRPSPVQILHLEDGQLVEACAPESVPEWAKPILMAVLKRL